ncbi:hypothetical protein D3C80_1852150 [compost metagenome]
MKEIRTCSILNKGIKPGSGINKDLPEIGHVGILGVVNIAGFMERSLLNATRLYDVMNLATMITEGIQQSIPISPLERYYQQQL